MKKQITDFFSEYELNPIMKSASLLKRREEEEKKKTSISISPLDVFFRTVETRRRAVTEHCLFSDRPR